MRLSARGPLDVVQYLLAIAMLLLAAAPVCGQSVIENPTDPPTRDRIELRESWRVGADDEDVLLGQVGVVAADRQGRLYALDSQLAQLQVFDPQGVHLETLSREGDGPGEVRQPIDVCLPGDGTVAILQPFPAKVTYLDLVSGNPVGSFQLGSSDPMSGGMGFMRAMAERGGTLLVAAMGMSFDLAEETISEQRYLAIVDRQGNELRRVNEVSLDRKMTAYTVDEVAEYLPHRRSHFAVGPDGRIYTATSCEHYEITVQDSEGNVERIIRRDHDPRPRTDEELAERRDSGTMNFGGQEPRVSHKLLDTNHPIAGLVVLENGSLWVLNSHSDDRWDDDGIMVYDVYDALGKLQREVEVVVPEGGQNNRLTLLDSGRFMMIKGLDSLSVSVSVSSGGDDDEPNQDLDGTTTTEELLELVYFEPTE